MPINSRFATPLPDATMPTWLFGSPTSTLPETPLIIDASDPERYLSMSSYRRQSQRFAQGLLDAGFQAGDAVFFVTLNNLACPMIYMGTWMAGGRCTGTYASVPVEHVTHLVEDSECKFLLADEESYHKCVEALGRIPSSAVESVFLIHDGLLFNPAFGKLDSQGRSTWSRFLGLETQGEDFDWRQRCSDPDQIACLNYTSGSTGPPKGVIMTHRTILASCVAHLAMQRSDPDEVNWVKNATWLTWTPIVFPLTLLQAVINAPHRGIRNYVMPGIDISLATRYIAKYRPTQLVFSPAMARDFLSHPDVRNADLSSVTGLDVGGQALPQVVKEQLQGKFVNAKVLTSFGMTETGAFALAQSRIDKDTSWFTGEVLANFSAKVMSLDGRQELDANEGGHLWLHGPAVTRGYWKRADTTAKNLTVDGWLKTGDLAYFRDDGKICVLDRVENVIQTSAGHQVIPFEVESAIMEIPGVQEAVVLGMRNNLSSFTSESRAFVTIRNDSSITAQNITQELKKRLDDSQQVSGGVFVLPAMPKLAVKIDRQALRNLDVSGLS